MFVLGCVIEIVKCGDGFVVMEFMYKKQFYYWCMIMVEDLCIFCLLKNNYLELDVDIYVKMYYLILFGYDIIYFLMEKFGMFEKNVFLDLFDIIVVFMLQLFVYICCILFDEYILFGFVYVIIVFKKCVDCWFK